jgi:hypothetical protein
MSAPAAVLIDAFGQRFQSLLFARHHGNVVAGRGEAPADSEAKSATDSGDQHNFLVSHHFPRIAII